MIELLNLGAGVQSSTLALMSAAGEMPKLDYAIFADTQWEPKAVYDWFDWLRPKLEDAGIEVVKVTEGDIRDGLLEEGKRFAAIPYFVKNKTGERGMVRRQCTAEYKIRPIERYIKEKILGLSRRSRFPKEQVVRQWFGISLDEIQRAKGFPKKDKWRSAWYPLIEHRMRRSECLAWMERNGYPRPPRSACIGCPFHTNREWVKIRDAAPAEWKEALELDAALRNREGLDGEGYLHGSLLPLGDASIDDFDPGQQMLWQDECEGYCGN